MTTARGRVLCNRIVLLGPPGAGKGTQGAALSRRIGVPSISTGDMLRDHVDRGTDLGVRIRRVLDAGGFVEDSIVDAMVAEEVERLGHDRGFILDGYPRTLAQVQALDSTLSKIDAQLSIVIQLTVPRTELRARLTDRRRQSGRVDDDPATVERRWEIYDQITAPIAATYASRDLLVNVDGSGHPDVVSERVRRAADVFVAKRAV